MTLIRQVNNVQYIALDKILSVQNLYLVIYSFFNMFSNQQVCYNSLCQDISLYGSVNCSDKCNNRGVCDFFFSFILFLNNFLQEKHYCNVFHAVIL